jgi:hypothetical protein
LYSVNYFVKSFSTEKWDKIGFKDIIVAIEP